MIKQYQAEMTKEGKYEVYCKTEDKRTGVVCQKAQRHECDTAEEAILTCLITIMNQLQSIINKGENKP